MRRRTKTLLALACVCFSVAAGSALAQAPAAPETRALPVSVVGRDGKPVLGLTAGNFRGEFRGQPVRIVSVVQSRSPRRIAVVVDTSGDMWRPRQKWELACALAEDLVLQLDPDQSVALFTFAEEVHQQTEFTSAHDAVAEALSRARAARPRGRSAIRDAIAEILRRQSASDRLDALYLVTDCEDNTSKSSREEAEIGLASAGVRTYTAWLMNPIPPPDPQSLVSAPEWLCRRLPEVSGGLRIWFQHTAPPTGALKKARFLYGSMNHVYQVEVVLPSPVDKPQEWKLEVVDERGKKLKNIELAYPRLLVPLSDATANK